jgi:hypothetical protein
VTWLYLRHDEIASNQEACPRRAQLAVRCGTVSVTATAFSMAGESLPPSPGIEAGNGGVFAALNVTPHGRWPLGHHAAPADEHVELNRVKE